MHRTFSGNPLLAKHQNNTSTGGMSFFEDPREKEKREIEATVKKHPLYYMTLKQALSHDTFWHLFVMIFFSMSYSYFIKPNIKKYGLSFENEEGEPLYNDKFLTMIASMSYLVSAVAKFTWGAVLDKFGFRFVYFIMLFLQIFTCSTVNLVG